VGINHRIFVVILLFAVVCSALASLQLFTVNRASALDMEDAGQLAVSFTERVAQLNVSAGLNLSQRIATSRLPSSKHLMTDVKTVIGNGSDAVETITTFLDGRLWMYNLYCTPELLKGQRSLNECLAIANLSITRYRSLFNTDSSDGLIDMLPNADTNQSSTVEDSKTLLKVALNTNCSTPLDYERYVILQWYKKIDNQFITASQSIRMTLSQSGLLTGFVDNIATHYVATTDIGISADQATNISRPYAEAYAAVHGKQIAGTETTLRWDLDSNSQRGDDCAIYPVWVFYAAYDDASQGLYGYEVSIWADNGQVIAQGPAATLSGTGGSASFASEFLWVFLGVALMVVGCSFCGTYLKRKSCRRSSK
jgi:hypothetical protein